MGIVEGSCGYRARWTVFGENSFYGDTRGTKLGGRHVAKRSSDPRIAYPEVTVQVRDLVRIVGIIDPLPHGVSVFGESSICRDQGCKSAQETCTGCPHQRYATGELSKVQGRDRVGIVEGSCGYRARGISIWGRNPGYETRGVAMWLHVVLTHGYPNPKSQVRYGTY